ncbi:MAG: ABC transporter substrate-binding protein [Thaumarchaeota archaeon]|nr:ABC transporter substrate-binding protein [Nitrososphaerota archaeon]
MDLRNSNDLELLADPAGRGVRDNFLIVSIMVLGSKILLIPDQLKTLVEGLYLNRGLLTILGFRGRRALTRVASVIVAVIIVVAVAAGGYYVVSLGTKTTPPVTTTTGPQSLTNVTFGFAGPPDITDTPGFMFWQTFAHQEGINLNVQYFDGDASVAEALVAGSIQVAEGGFQSTLLADESSGNSSGSYPFLIFSNYEAINDYALIVSNSITSFSQLAGQPIATSGPGSSSNLFCKLLLAAHGITGSQANCAPIGGGGARYRALIAGQVVGDIAEPFQIVSGVATGKYHIIATVPQLFPTIMFSVLYTSRTYAQANPTVITKITAAILLADRWAQNETQWIAKEQVEFPGTNVTIASTAWKIWAAMGLWQPNGGLSETSVSTSEQFLLNSSQIKSFLAVKYFVDLTHLHDALTTLGNYTAGVITNPNIPTIPVTIPGFGGGGGGGVGAAAATWVLLTRRSRGGS